MKTFKIDHRDNAGLHALYVKGAVKDILTIDRTIKSLSDLSRTTVSGALAALFNERAKLIRNDAAAAEAVEFLEELVHFGLLTKCEEIYLALEKVEQ